MKKYFLFAAVAGMLVSCSSESLTGSDPNIEPTPTQEERVPILLNVSTPSINVSRGTTRGTGTVGGVGVANTDATNVWYGQRINAFMFTKDENHATTLNLAVVDATIPSPVAYYDNAVMITPGTTENLIPGQSTATNIGEAMLADGTIQYYPSSGNFDFFGYHGAGVTSNLTKTSDPWTVDFTIDGSNDLMSTKAAPQAWSALTTDQKAKFADDETAYNTFINGTGTLLGDFYSAKAARKLIQPVLSFNHLLSRLAFVIKAGNDNAGGWPAEGAATFTAATAAAYNATLDGAINAGVALTAEQATAYNTAMGASKSAGDTLTADEANAYNATLVGAKAAGDAAVQNSKTAVSVKSIEVYSKRKGKMAVAWTADPGANMITWTGDGSPDWLALQERPVRYCLNSAPATATSITKADYDALPDDATTGDANDKTDYSLGYSLNSNPTTVITKADYDALPDGATDGDANDKTDYSVLTNAIDNLVALTPTYPTMSTSGTYPETSIGEALIVAPSTEVYKMRVKVSQMVPTDWTKPTVLAEKNQTYELLIPLPEDDPATSDVNEGVFQANTSYKVVLTVYGFERIEVKTEITPWIQGQTLNVGQDE